ncbi:membrane protein insertion efficiency factor YidD [Campylobacter sp.]|uniref:membrane protein insertion efficiency factor YidD n=1 Tax=Campylobacter sp. TaxID=205 RepID=UPI0026DB0977|nr:membrane protein insertion efficiency factor YidD [Campylobacter sp.]MDO4674141.1 membrane protein insertion efficiency factor YidD [Campylobacter sp.]
MFKIAFLASLRFYQSVLSPLKPPVCRYYPSCSHYALWQLEKNHPFRAFVRIFFRILKCNPLFKGGFDYPKISKKFRPANFCFKPFFLAQKPLKFLYVPRGGGDFYLIKIVFKRIQA